MDEADRHTLGMKTRRSVLGDAHVDRTIVNKTPFNADFQDFITRGAWGEIWTRPLIDHTTRRLLVVMAMIALNRVEEFKLHFRAALEHGVDPELLKEVLMQSAIYCGVPAANSAFHWAAEVMSEGTKA